MGSWGGCIRRWGRAGNISAGEWRWLGTEASDAGGEGEIYLLGSGDGCGRMHPTRRKMRDISAVERRQMSPHASDAGGNRKYIRRRTATDEIPCIRQVEKTRTISASPNKPQQASSIAHPPQIPFYNPLKVRYD